MRCDYIAEGVIKATKDLSLNVPLIVRLKGTKEAEAKQSVLYFMLKTLLLKIIVSGSSRTLDSRSSPSMA